MKTGVGIPSWHVARPTFEKGSYLKKEIFPRGMILFLVSAKKDSETVSCQFEPLQQNIVNVSIIPKHPFRPFQGSLTETMDYSDMELSPNPQSNNSSRSSTPKP
ncbi:hypothetical protein TNCV_2984971 [Trichonephila clavipes]|nr:hypothetical protein TNCV_2984971 [Trichonephila clavipes]